MPEFEARVIEIIERTHNVRSFRFSGREDIDFKAGQYLFVSIKIGGEYKTKPFSFSNSPTEQGYIEFTKKLTDSPFSGALRDLRLGDTARLKTAFGDFTFEGEYEKVAFLSGGIGITPIRSICKNACDKKLDTDIVLLYGNRTPEDIVFRDDFDRMQKDYRALKTVHVISQPEESWRGRTGHITAGMIKEEIPDYNQRRFYICGPPAMVKAMRQVITEELGMPQERAITENFAGY